MTSSRPEVKAVLLSVLSECLLNADRHGASATSLGSLFQCLSNLTVKNFFLLSSLTIPWHSFVHSRISCRQLWWAETDTFLCTSPHQEFVGTHEVTSGHLFSKLDKPSILNLYTWDVPSSPFTSLMICCQLGCDIHFSRHHLVVFTNNTETSMLGNSPVLK